MKSSLLLPWIRSARRLGLVGCWLALLCLVQAPAFGAFGLVADPIYYTVDTGAGLVFKVRRVDLGSSTQSAGDLASLVYNGVEYQNQSRGSQVNSGFDWLYNNVSAVDVTAETVGTDFVKVTVKGGQLTHYYLARAGHPHIYMATHFTAEPNVHGLVRYIVRIPSTLLPNGPEPSDIRNNTGAIESGDIFGLANGHTRSKHYSNLRLKDWSHIGATGSGVGVWMVRDNNEGNSGGPFYRSLLMQTGDDQEITYIVNYGMTQTEPFRLGVLNHYTLVFTDGAPPPAMLDTSWFSELNLLGYVAPAGRGSVTGTAITGRHPGFAYTVGFANATAQYWADAAPADGAFACNGMIPGTYTVRVYKNELVVWTGSATVAAGESTALNTIAITADPSALNSLWRIGDWDGTPWEFLNGDKVTTMHPSDVRMSPWATPAYVVGTSTPAAGFPAYQWARVNSPLTVKFHLNASQLAAYSARVGITVAYANARPRLTVNGWTSSIPSISTQPGTRSLTVGTYRGNNTTYTFNVPLSAFVAGENTLTISAVSGSGAALYLSAGYSIDAVDLTIQPPAMANATANGIHDAAFSYTLVATNAPTSFAATGLPAGLTLDSATGVISGVPTVVGTFAVPVSATNANGTASATLTIKIVDATAPVLTLPADLVVEATGPDGATATFSATALDAVDGSVPVTLTPASGSTFPLGTTTVAASATDAAGNTATGAFTVTVRDTTAPVISSLATSKTVLWPVTHKMVKVNVSAVTSDAVSAVSTRIIAVASNEPVDSPEEDGATSPDWEITGNMSVELRAERSGLGTGRIYTLTVEARDAAGNTSTATTTVSVPIGNGEG